MTPRGINTSLDSCCPRFIAVCRKQWTPTFFPAQLQDLERHLVECIESGSMTLFAQSWPTPERNLRFIANFSSPFALLSNINSSDSGAVTIDEQMRRDRTQKIATDTLSSFSFTKYGSKRMHVPLQRYAYIRDYVCACAWMCMCDSLCSYVHRHWTICKWASRYSEEGKNN